MYDLDPPDPPDCVFAFPTTIGAVDMIHNFEGGKCTMCGWKREKILKHKNFRPWDAKLEEAINEDADREMIGNDVDFGLGDIGGK